VRWRSLTASVAVAFAAAGSGVAATPPKSGLYGVVMRGPITPVCRIGKPCSAPANGVVIVFARYGRVAARVRTGIGGRYRVSLAAGRYTVRLPVRPAIGRGLEPPSVLVRAGRYVRADFALDTGIR
jgi:hypothetical protein